MDKVFSVKITKDPFSVKITFIEKYLIRQSKNLNTALCTL